MFCPNCGKEISDLASVCVNCGATFSKSAQKADDSASAGWWWLGFLVPIAGLIIWLTCKDETPNRAKKAGWGALISTIVSVALVILYFIAVFALIAIGISLS